MYNNIDMYMHMYMYIHRGFESHLRQLIFLKDCLGCAVLLCLVICLTLLASFFLPSHLSLHIDMYMCICACMYMYMMCICACILTCTCVYVHVCTCTCVYVHVCTCTCTCFVGEVYSLRPIEGEYSNKSPFQEINLFPNDPTCAYT